MEKYFKSEDGIKIKISGNNAYIKRGDKEVKAKHPSSVITNIIIENNPISKAEYEK